MTTITYYVALPFACANDGAIVPGKAVECPSAEIAILQAEFLSQAAGNVGAIAFSRTGDPDVGKFEDAVGQISHHLITNKPPERRLVPAVAPRRVWKGRL